MKPLDSPGPLGHHYGPLHPRVYSPDIPDKNNVYTKRLEPLQVGEEITLPCEAKIVVDSISPYRFKQSGIFSILSVDIHNSGVSFGINLDGSQNILIREDSIPLLIETLQRAFISFE